MSVKISTKRGTVSVLDADCKHRPCLHDHWSRHPESSRILANGKRVDTFPLVCIRREEYGCPYPLPEPERAS